MTPTVSVIVPMYNAENFIKPALESLLTQTFTDFEVILIDDCSTDRTLDKLMYYEEKYPDNILLIALKENVRMGAARNLALKYATGEYISFVDSDD